MRTALAVPCHSSTAVGNVCYILWAIFQSWRREQRVSTPKAPREANLGARKKDARAAVTTMFEPSARPVNNRAGERRGNRPEGVCSNLASHGGPFLHTSGHFAQGFSRVFLSYTGDTSH